MHEKKGHNCPCFQNVLEKIINIGNISNLPASISKIKSPKDISYDDASFNKELIFECFTLLNIAKFSSFGMPI